MSLFGAVTEQRAKRRSKYDISLEELREAMENPMPCNEPARRAIDPQPAKVYPISKTEQSKRDAASRRKQKIKAAWERDRLKNDPRNHSVTTLPMTEPKTTSN